MAAYESATDDVISVRRPGEEFPEQYSTEMISGNYFQMLGVNASLGRALKPADDQPNATPVAVMSYRVWQNNFHSEAKIVGETIMVSGNPFTLIGVMPPSFFGDALSQNPTELWLPLSLEPSFRQQGSLLHRWNQHWLMLKGRLRPGVNPGAVQPKLTDELQNWLYEQPIFDRQRESLPRQQLAYTA